MTTTDHSSSRRVTTIETAAIELHSHKEYQTLEDCLSLADMLSLELRSQGPALSKVADRLLIRLMWLTRSHSQASDLRASELLVRQALLSRRLKGDQ